MQWDGRTELLAAGVVLTEEERGGAAEVVACRKEEGEELEALKPPVAFKPGEDSGGKSSEALSAANSTTRSQIASLTSALGLPAAPSQGIKTLPSPRANQLVARLTQEVDLVPDTKHSTQAAAEGDRKSVV